MNKWKRWEFWMKARDWCNKKMTNAWMHGGNCDSRCLRCKRWESHGNRIETTSLDDVLEHRKCSGCGYEWRAIFTPAGFVPIDDESTNAKQILGDSDE